MAHNLETLFASRLVSGLQRKSIHRCSAWALKYRIMGPPFPGKFSFKYHPWLKAMHDSENELNIGQKGAQVGFTETVLNLCFFTLDILGKDVLYVLPAKTPDAKDFSSSRFDPALELSTHLSSIFSDVKNVGHKRAGTANMFIRGSHSRSGLKSLPIGRLIMDEVAEFTQENIPLAFERLAGQVEHKTWLLSTPTVEDADINVYFKSSNQQHFLFRCPSCSHYIELDFPNNLEIVGEFENDPRIHESRLICDRCKVTLNHDEKHLFLKDGIWEPQNNIGSSAGWYVNQLYSSAAKAHPVEIAKSYFRSLSSKSEEQQFYNSKLGKPHAVKGSQVTDSIIKACTGTFSTHNTRPATARFITMGVDQGLKLHYEIDAWYPSETPGYDTSNSWIPQLIAEDTVINFEDLDRLMRQFGVNFCVIDSQPERRKATEFANRFPGLVRLCFYPEGINTKQIHFSNTGNEPSINVDRTTWLDTSLGRFFAKSIRLPNNLSYEYKSHMSSLTRTYKEDKHGNQIGRYVKSSKPDHFAHARNYAEIALVCAVPMGQSQNITEI